LEFAFNNLLKINDTIINIIKTNYNKRREVWQNYQKALKKCQQKKI
jgi:hypothetical protein